MATTSTNRAAVGRRSAMIPRLPRLRRPRVTPILAAAVLVLAVVIGVGWLWFRSSSLVSVRQVEVTGLSGPDVGEIRSALDTTVKQMTTLTISDVRLKKAIAGYGPIAGVRVSTHFPHGVTIHVDETIPIATISDGGRQVAVDGAGLLLLGDSTRGLPALSVAPAATGGQVAGASTRAVLSVLQAAPFQLLAHLKSARMTAAHGVTVTLRNGPEIYFGATTQLPLKWRAADASLASSYSAGAAYIDVSAPMRPAAGS
jgi:cell division protein FtsQ